MTDHLAVGIGTQLLGIVPGRVSTECDAHLSYDTQGTIDKVSRVSVQLVTEFSCHFMLTSRTAFRLSRLWTCMASRMLMSPSKCTLR